MSTPTGQISAKDVETTLNEGISTNYPGTISKMGFNDGLVRTLASKPSGAISMNDMRGKAGPTPYGTIISSGCSGSTLTVVTADGRYGTTTTTTNNSPACAITASLTISSNTTNYILNPSKVSGYSAGKTTVTFTVNSGIYLYSTATGTPALTVSGFTAGDVINIVNNGYILGQGGKGSGAIGVNSLVVHPGGFGIGTDLNLLARGNFAPEAGGPAISLGYNVTITNNSYIAGGGGGGGRFSSYADAGYDNTLYDPIGAGGGGAGGGAGGDGMFLYYAAFVTLGGAGGGPGASGANGTVDSYSGGGSGGGGGRILPGTGGAGNNWNVTQAGSGGGAGGGGGGGVLISTYPMYPGGGDGGSAGNAGGNGKNAGRSGDGGGGGGWGASGGNPDSYGNGGTSGASGGKAVALNGYSVTWNIIGTRYGAIS